MHFNDPNFFCYMKYVMFLCSAGKIWSSICVQDILKAELHYQIHLTIRFLDEICLTDKSDGNNYLFV